MSIVFEDVNVRWDDVQAKQIGKFDRWMAVPSDDFLHRRSVDEVEGLEGLRERGDDVHGCLVVERGIFEADEGKKRRRVHDQREEDLV